VEEYESNGKTAKKCTKIGAAFPHKESFGFSIALAANLLGTLRGPFFLAI
jgi:hypothetical protein